MKKFLVMAALIVATLSVSAQDYEWAVGLRGGGFSGITAKQNRGENAIEAGLSFGGGLNIDATYQWQQPVIGEGFHLYYGAGAFVGLGGSVSVAAEGVVGLEYRLPIDLPLAVSVDYRPAIFVVPAVSTYFGNIGFGVKYCF